MRHHAKFRQNRSNACGDISRLTANNRDQLQNLTLGNRVGPYGLLFFCSLLFFNRPRYEGWPYHGLKNFFHLSLFSVTLIDSSTGSPVYVLMLSIQAARGLFRLRAPGIVPCIISFSRQLPCFLMV